MYEINPDDNSPLNDVDVFELFTDQITISPERKEEAEQLKNEGNRLMKEEKYQEALTTYSR